MNLKIQLQHIILSKLSQKHIKNLSTLAETGIPVERYVPFPTDYKFVLANNYSIFYRIDGDIVRVIRIMYSKRDFVKILFEDK